MAPPVMQKINKEYKLFVKNDLDSFLMLLFDNMSSLIAILGVMAFVVPSLAMPFGYNCANKTPGTFGATPVGICYDDHQAYFAGIVWTMVCPGIAWSLAFGNLWYAWMAAKLAGYESRTDVTALPYGINTPAGFVTAWNVMLPIGGALIAATPDMSPEDWAVKTWQTGCACNFIGGLFEIAGSAHDVRPYFSKAALYAPVAAVGFVWLALVPLTEVAKEPIIGLVPLALAFTGFFSNGGKGVYTKLAGGGAILIAAVGVLFKWCGCGKYTGDNDFMAKQVNSAWDTYAGENNFMEKFPLGDWSEVDKFVAVVFPVALASFIETMENVEAAAAEGDEYNLREAMIVDGVGTCVGAFFGSVIPTTVYIGHKRHKVIGAHAGYSILNAIFYFIVFQAGLFPVIFQIFDNISIGVILIIVGLIICQQAVEVSVTRHMPAFFIGIMCLICDWGTLNANATHVGIHNIAAGGGIMAALILPQILCDLTDNRYGRAAIFSAVGSIFSLFGIMHGMNPVDADDKVTTGFPIGGVYGQDGMMKVKGQLTIALKDRYPGWNQGMSFPWGEGTPTLCSQPPEFRVDQMMASGAPADGMNEGWRFAVAYAMVCVVCVFHWLLQKKGCFPPPIMDNGDKNLEDKGTSTNKVAPGTY